MTATVHITRPAEDADVEVEIVRRDPSNGGWEVIETLKRGETRIMHVWQGCQVLIREKKNGWPVHGTVSFSEHRGTAH